MLQKPPAEQKSSFGILVDQLLSEQENWTTTSYQQQASRRQLWCYSKHIRNSVN